LLIPTTKNSSFLVTAITIFNIHPLACAITGV
jgi:hypothetical protein